MAALGAVDLKIAETAGLTYIHALIPHARSLTDLGDGVADFVVRFNIAALPGGATQLVSIVGMLRGGVFDDRFAKDEAVKKYEAAGYDQIFRMLMLDRFDAAIGSSAGLYWVANNQGLGPEQPSTPLVLNTQEFILHFPKKTTNAIAVAALKAATEN